MSAFDPNLPSAFGPLQTLVGHEITAGVLSLTSLETAAMRSIFSETPDLAPTLEQQLQSAEVTSRENTGGGFFTHFVVPEEVPPASTSEVLGYETLARVDGLEHGFGFVLFMKDGRIHFLEGYANGPENTAPLDLETLKFEIYKQTPIRL